MLDFCEFLKLQDQAQGQLDNILKSALVFAVFYHALGQLDDVVVGRPSLISAVLPYHQ